MIGVIVGHGQGGIAFPVVQLYGIGRRVFIQHLAVQRPAEALIPLYGVIRRCGNRKPHGRAVALVAQQSACRFPVVIGAVIKLLTLCRLGKVRSQVHQLVIKYQLHLVKYRILIKEGGITRQLIPQGIAGGRHRHKGQIFCRQSFFLAPGKEILHRLQVLLQPCFVPIGLGHLFDVIPILTQVHPADILVAQQHFHFAAGGGPAIPLPELIA